jgi:hypothetical protein
MLAHSGNEAGLASRRFGGVGDERQAARLIEGIVDPRGEFRVERSGDFEITRPTVWVRRARKFAAARVAAATSGLLRSTKVRGRDARVPGDIPHGRAQALPPTIAVFRSF